MIRDYTIFSGPLLLGEGWGEGGHGKLYQLFGDQLNAIIDKPNETLAA